MTKEVNSDYLPKELQPLWARFLNSSGEEEDLKIMLEMEREFRKLPRAKQQRLMEAFQKQPQGMTLEPIEE